MTEEDIASEAERVALGPIRGASRRRRAPPPMPLPFIAAKVARPRMLWAQVRRPRLIDQLDAAARCPVTVVCAGAGWGKTVMVSSWVETRRAPTAWLTLDERDNDARIFWSYVMAALRADGAVAPHDSLADLQGLPDDDIERTGRLARGFGRLSAPAVLVLDDFQEIDDVKILQDLAGLLRHPPPQLHLILITRTEPTMPLHRLRAAGGLAEIRADELAFTAGEAADLFARHELILSVDDIAALVDRTEGWPTGLKLAAAFLTGPDGPRPVADFTGDVRLVDEYLASEVLATQPPDVRQFLLWTCICEHLCAGLADAVTLQIDGQRTLAELERVNDFVVRLGVKPEWYRYHHLLRDALRHRLLLESPDLVPELHRRAARWNAAHNSILEALGHAVAAEDWQFVAHLVITKAAPLILSANRSAMVKRLRRVPPEQLSSTAELMVCAALLLFYAGDFDAIPDRLAGARALLSERPENERLPVEITLRALQVSVYRAVGDMPALVAEATDLLGQLVNARFAQVPSLLQYRAIALNNKGVGLLWTGRADLAERYLWAASTAARSAGVELAEINASGHLAVLEVMRGSVTEGARLAGYAVDLADRRGWINALQCVAAHLARVLVHLERNELAEAQRAFRQGLRAHRGEPEAAQRMAWIGAEAQLALAHGEVARARALLQDARRRRDPRMRAPAVDRWLLLTECELDLMTGRPEQVEARYAVPAGKDSPTMAEQVCRARAAFALRDLQRAEDLLATAPAVMSETVATVQARILTALIADARGHGRQAGDALVEALTLAESEGIRRPFIAMANGRLEQLVGRQGLVNHRDGSFTTDIPSLMTVAKNGRSSHPASSLSDREVEVLHFLPTVLTAGEIATELGVSINTVKAHMRSIYRKLDATRRRQAVTRAHEYGLL